jgi:hypothetical protein
MTLLFNITPPCQASSVLELDSMALTGRLMRIPEEVAFE